MVERSEQIERQIAFTRSELGSNLQDLEDKFEQAADWRTHFERNPMMLMGLALGGGVLLGAITSDNGHATTRSPNSSNFGRQNGFGDETWNIFKGALIGLAGSKIRTLLDEALPGFNEHYERMLRNSTASSPHAQS